MRETKVRRLVPRGSRRTTLRVEDLEGRQLLSHFHPHTHRSVTIVVDNQTFVHQGGTLVPISVQLSAEDDHTYASGAEIDNTRELKIGSQLPANQVAGLILQIERHAMQGI